MARFKDRLRRAAAKLMVIAVGLLFGCMVAEIGLRIIGYSYPIFYQPDTVRGYTPIPELEGWAWPENKTYVRHNREGFRDIDHDKQKPANTIRIAVIGDSFSEAKQVPVESTFWNVFQRELAASPALAGKNVEVLNFGVGGYGTGEELLTLRQRVWDYSPDIVLLAVCTYNDVTDNYELFKNAAELPYFKLENNELVYDNSFLQAPKYLWHDSTFFRAWVAAHNHSRLLQLLHHAQFGIKSRIQAWKAQKRFDEASKTLQTAKTSQQSVPSDVLVNVVGVENLVFREPRDQDWEQAWRVTEALISQIGQEVSQHGAKLMVVTIPSDIQVYPDTAVRQAMLNNLGVADLFYPDRRLAALAERQGIPFLDLAVPMQQAADRDKVFFHGFGQQIGNGHWNEAGHKFAGELIAGKLEEIIRQ